jgi:cell wall-associated NlpC family hydrolase
MRCAVPVAPVRAGPHDDAEQVTQALGGEPLRVEEQHNGWARVVTAYDYPGCSGLVHMAYRRVGRLVPRDADQQAEAGISVDELQVGDLITYGDPVDHIAFWLGDGRILHSTGRGDGIGVVGEAEPDDLRVRRHKLIRL